MNVFLRLAWDVVLAIAILAAMHWLDRPIDWPSALAGMVYVALSARVRRGAAE